MEFSVHQLVLLLAFVLALGLGAVMNKTRFCTMGAVSDWINMGHCGRLGAWFLAIAVAIGGVVLLEALNLLAVQNKTLGASFPPYRTAQFAWLRYVLGGLMFGVGMTLAGGCGSRTFVRIGGGSLKSLVVIVVIAIVAYFMVWTDLYQKAFAVWLAPTTINFARWGISSQELGAVVAGFAGIANAELMHLILGGIVALTFLAVALRSRDVRQDGNNVFGGLAVGIAIVAGWLVTGGPLSGAWGEHALMATEPPIRVAAQSFTFIAPTADVANLLLNPTRLSLISFGVVAFFGVILGSLLYAVVARQFRFEWFASMGDFINHIIGGVLMGVGGVLAMGCTIGQGITGMSTLAIGSFLALAAMIAGSALTMKVQYSLLNK